MHRFVHSVPQLGSDLFYEAPHTLRDWLATQSNPPTLGLTAIVCKSQKVKGLGAPLAAVPTVSFRKTTKLDEPRFVRMKAQSEFLQTCPQLV